MSFDAKSIRRQLMADKKKFGTLLALAVFGLLLWGRLMINGGVPRTATATPTSLASAAPADKTAVRTGSSLRRTVELMLVSDVKRDLFWPDPQGYQVIPDGKPEKQAVEAKSGPAPADELQQRQEMIRAEARQLSLQSTLLGSAPKAMINRVLVSVGERIQGFELVEIRSRQVTLQKDGVIVVLEM